MASPFVWGGRAVVRAVLTFVAICGVIVLTLSLLGRWVPMGDALAVVRVHVLVLAVPVLVALVMAGGAVRAGVIAVPVLAVLAVTVWQYRGPAPRMPAEPSGRVVTLYQKNLLWNGADPAAILADILASDADIVTLQETSERNAVVADGLAAAYPHRLTCSTSGNGGIALYARWPLRQPGERCAFANGLVVAEATLPDGSRLWIGSVHLNWPWPYRQARQMPGIVERLASLDGPVVIAGDFNMVPWGSSVRRVARAAGVRRLGQYWTTFPQFGRAMPLPIDQVLIPQGAAGRLEVRPLLGSDHLGLLARFALPPVGDA